MTKECFSPGCSKPNGHVGSCPPVEEWERRRHKHQRKHRHKPTSAYILGRRGFEYHPELKRIASDLDDAVVQFIEDAGRLVVPDEIVAALRAEDPSIKMAHVRRDIPPRLLNEGRIQARPGGGYRAIEVKA